jgi:hypothetical protein
MYKHLVADNLGELVRILNKKEIKKESIVKIFKVNNYELIYYEDD